jgi:hypothetical protein
MRSGFWAAASAFHFQFCQPSGYLKFKTYHYHTYDRLARCCQVRHTFLANLSTCLSFQGKKSEAIEICDRTIQVARHEPLLSQLKHQRISIASDEPKQIVTLDC